MKRKLMIVLTCAAIIIASIAFVACDNKTAANDPRANANILVEDSHMQPLQGATVTLAAGAKGQSVKSNADGVATLANLKVGSHQAKVTLDGYAPMIINFDIATPTMLGDTPVAITTTETVTMSKLGAAVAGKVQILKNGQNVPLQNAQLKLILSGDYAKVLFETTSDADGKYTFTDLPENASYKITGAKVVSEDVIYVTNGLSSGKTGFIWDGTKRITSTVNYTPEAEQFVVTSNRVSVMSAQNTPIVIDFSLPVDLTSLRDSYIYTTILVDKEWSNDNKRLTITPANGDWNSGSVNVTLSGNIQSTLGILLSSDSNITIYHAIVENNMLPNVGTITPVDGNNMNNPNETTRDTLKLTWAAIAGASGYQVHYRYNGTSSFAEIYSPNISSSGDAVTLDLSGVLVDTDFVDDNSVDILVYATNEYGRSQKGTLFTINTIALEPVNP